MKKNTPAERLINGILLENPTLVLTLGMCPTLAVTTSAINGLGMGLTTTAVLMFSNMIISLLRNFIPDRVRIPSYIVVIASLVTIVQFVLQAYVPTLNEALGVYIPLIVVNCIILGRAESYAGKNGPISSFFDGLGMGLGFTGALTILGALRELLGAGTFFNIQILPESVYTPITIFILAPGAFLVLSCMVAVQNRIKNNPPKKAAAKEEAVPEEATKETTEAPAEKAKEDTSVKALEDKGAPAADLIKEAQKAKAAKEAVEVKAADVAKDVKAAKAAEPAKDLKEIKAVAAADKAKDVDNAEAAKEVKKAEKDKEAPEAIEANKAEEAKEAPGKEKAKEAKEASEANAVADEKEIKDSKTVEENRTFKYDDKVSSEEKKKGKKDKDFKESHGPNKGKRKKKPKKARDNNNPGQKKPNVKKESKDAKKEGGES